MLYRLLFNYFRIKMFQFILARLLGSKNGKKINALKNMSLGAYVIEWLATNFLKPTKKTQ